MISCDIKACRGPSLFAEESCLCLTLYLSNHDRKLLDEHDQEAARSFGLMVREIRAEEAKQYIGSNNECFLAGAIVGLSAFFLSKLDALRGGPWITKLPDESTIHIAYSDFHPRTTEIALRLALRFAVHAYPRELDDLFPRSLVQGDPTKDGQRFLSNGRNSKKLQLMGEVQMYLNDRKIQWFHLDRFSDSKNFIQIGFGRYQHLIDNSAAFESSRIGVKITTSKRKTSRFLADLGFPITEQFVVHNVEGAIFAADSLGYPVVVKPEYGMCGDNVHVALTDAAEVREAVAAIQEDWKMSKRNGPDTIIVEEFVEGKDYRLHVVAGKLLEVMFRTPAQIKGDGTHSIAELVERENNSYLRRSKTDSELGYVKLNLGKPELSVLKRQGLTPASIPPAGETVFLRRNANWSSGGKHKFLTGVIHPDNAALAERIAEALKIKILGVDVIVNDISESYLEGGLRVIEANYAPGIIGTLNERGGFEEKGSRMVDLLAPDAANCYVPIIIVSEGRGSQKLTEFIGDALSGCGLAPGVVNTSGMSIKGELWSRPEALDYLDPALPVLRNMEIDAAVIERNFPTLLDGGTGTGGCDISVILSVPDNKIVTECWRDGIEAARAAEMLLKTARKNSIVCIDDPLLAARIEQISPFGLCVLSQKGLSGKISQLLSSGAKAIVMDSLDQEKFRMRVFLPGPECDKNGIQVQVSADNPDPEEALNAMAVLGVLLCLDYSLDVSLLQIEKMFISKEVFIVSD